MGFIIGTGLAIAIIIFFIVMVVRRTSKGIEHAEKIDKRTKELSEEDEQAEDIFERDNIEDEDYYDGL